MTTTEINYYFQVYLGRWVELSMWRWQATSLANIWQRNVCVIAGNIFCSNFTFYHGTSWWKTYSLDTKKNQRHYHELLSATTLSILQLVLTSSSVSLFHVNAYISLSISAFALHSSSVSPIFLNARLSLLISSLSHSSFSNSPFPHQCIYFPTIFHIPCRWMPDSVFSSPYFTWHLSAHKFPAS